jgi:hypothetical protein
MELRWHRFFSVFLSTEPKTHQILVNGNVPLRITKKHPILWMKWTSVIVLRYSSIVSKILFTVQNYKIHDYSYTCTVISRVFRTTVYKKKIFTIMQQSCIIVSTSHFFLRIIRDSVTRWWLRKGLGVIDYPKLRFANPFFRLKIGRFKATARRVAHPSMYSINGLSDPAEFSKVRYPI